MDYVIANKVRAIHPAKSRNHKELNWFWIIIFLINTIIFIQIVRGIHNTIMLLYLQNTKRQEVAAQYIKLIDYKNKLDTVTAEGYLDYILKNNLQLYTPGEKLVIIDQALLTGLSGINGDTDACATTTKLRSRYIILHGIRSLDAD